MSLGKNIARIAASTIASYTTWVAFVVPQLETPLKWRAKRIEWVK